MSLGAVALQTGAVALGAALGAILRWQASLRLGLVVAGFPMGTLLVNLVGGFLIGLAIVWFRLHPEETNSRLLIVTGFLGGLTTFSSFSGSPCCCCRRGRCRWRCCTAPRTCWARWRRWRWAGGSGR